MKYSVHHVSSNTTGCKILYYKDVLRSITLLEDGPWVETKAEIQLLPFILNRYTVFSMLKPTYRIEFSSGIQTMDPTWRQPPLLAAETRRTATLQVANNRLWLNLTTNTLQVIPQVAQQVASQVTILCAASLHVCEVF